MKTFTINYMRCIAILIHLSVLMLLAEKASGYVVRIEVNSKKLDKEHFAFEVKHRETNGGYSFKIQITPKNLSIRSHALAKVYIPEKDSILIPVKESHLNKSRLYEFFLTSEQFQTARFEFWNPDNEDKASVFAGTIWWFKIQGFDKPN